MANKKSSLKDAVRAEMNDIENIKNGDKFVQDEELDLGQIAMQSNQPGGARLSHDQSKKIHDEIVIDELLASVPRNQGYYLKLYREIRPNEFELKLRIDNYESWSDMELEITNLVRAYTLKSPKKWGTGMYRTVVWREGGIRGQSKWKPVHFYVDAMEDENNLNASSSQGPYEKPVDAGELLREQVGTVAELLKVVQTGNPPVTSPAEQMKLMAESFNTGMAAKSGNNTNMTALITAGITALAPLLLNKNNGAADQQTMFLKVAELLSAANKPPVIPTPIDPLETIIKLREAGILPDNQNNKSPQDSIFQTMEMIKILKPLFGDSGGESASISSKLIDSVGPHIGKIVTDITGTLNHAITNRSAQKKIRSEQSEEYDDKYNLSEDSKVAPNFSPMDNNISNNESISMSNTPIQKPEPTQIQSQPATKSEESMPIMIPALRALNTAINKNDSAFFPTLEELLERVTTPEEFNNIIEGKISHVEVFNQLVVLGGKSFNNAQTSEYLRDFIKYKQEQKKNEVLGTCNKCKEEYVFPNKEELQRDNKCSECEGTVEEIVEENQEHGVLENNGNSEIFKSSIPINLPDSNGNVEKVNQV